MSVDISDPKKLSIADVRQLVRNPEAVTDAIESLLVTLQTNDEELSAWVNDALQLTEKVPVALAPRLEQLCQDSHAPSAVWACRLVTKLEDPAQQQNSLRKALEEHEHLGVKQEAAASLARIGGLNQETFRALEQAARSQDPRLSRLAKQAIENTRAA